MNALPVVFAPIFLCKIEGKANVDWLSAKWSASNPLLWFLSIDDSKSILPTWRCIAMVADARAS